MEPRNYYDKYEADYHARVGLGPFGGRTVSLEMSRSRDIQMTPETALAMGHRLIELAQRVEASV